MVDRHAIRRRRADYLAATRNEIAIDAMAFALARRSPARSGYLPRPAKWIARTSGRDFLSWWCWRSSSVVWRFGGAAAFFLLQMLSALREYRRLPARPDASSASGYVLAFSSRVGDILDRRSFPFLPSCWITFPWAPLENCPSDAIRCHVFSLLSPRDFWLAWRDACAATAAMARGVHSKWILQTYTAFRWFCTRAAIDKLEGTFVMASHFDRWAVLADSAISRRKALGRQSARLVLVQHGAMGALSRSADEDRPALRLARRLRSVDQLFAYDEQSADAFRADVFSQASVRRKIDVRFFRPAIKTTRLIAPGKPRVLFVGHPLCEELHLHVLQELHATSDFEAFYKPHPVMGMTDRMDRVEWRLVLDRNMFPEVDFLISYPSTLVVEYENAGAPAVVHSLDLSASDAEGLISATRQRLHELRVVAERSIDTAASVR